MVVLSQFGYYCFYAYQIYHAKQLAKEQLLQQIPDAALTKISTTDKIYWEEEGKELRFNGQMFDVVREKTENGKAYLLCVSDEKEDGLFMELSDLIKVNTDANTTGKHSLNLKFQPIDIFCNTPNNFLTEKVIAYSVPEFYEFESALHLTYKKVHFPPPKI